MPKIAVIVLAFVATNIDDILLLTVFFSAVGKEYEVHHIVWGQFLGISALCLLSLPGYLGGALLPKPWIGLLGFLPLIMGFVKLVDLAKGDADTDEENQQLTANADTRPGDPDSTKRPFLALLFSPQVYTVAAVTVADGSDNLGIYIPLFATCNLPQLLGCIATFLLLTGVWLFIGYWVSRHPLMSSLLGRYSHILIPVVLIGLGLYVLIDSESYRLIGLRL
eukprot:EG_transcript_20506